MAGLYIVFEAWRLGTSWPTLGRMIVNVAIDTALGAIPIAGDLFDFAWQSNTRNLRLMGIEPLGSGPGC